MSTAKLTIVNTMPILVPAILKSVVKLLKVAGKRLCMAALEIPLITAHAYNPPREETPIQQRVIVDETKQARIRAFKGPL